MAALLALETSRRLDNTKTLPQGLPQVYKSYPTHVTVIAISSDTALFFLSVYRFQLSATFVCLLKAQDSIL